MTSKSIMYKIIIKYELNTAVVQGTIIHEFPYFISLVLSEDLEQIAVIISVL